MVPSPSAGDRADAAAPPRRLRPARSWLVTTAGPFPGETHPLAPGAELIVGSARGSDIRLPPDDASPLHAKIKCSASGRVEVTDMGSVSGTMVNGRRQLYRLLREDDLIQFGERTALRFAATESLPEDLQRRLLGTVFLDPTTLTQTRERLVAFLEQAFRAGAADLSLVVMAVDGFDLVEGLLGAAVRDQFLRELAGIVRKEVAGETAVHRVRPHAFAGAFPGLPAEGALDIAERLRQAIAVSRLSHAGDQMVFTLALGVASRLADAPSGPDRLIDLATLRCQAAAAGGGDRTIAAAV